MTRFTKLAGALALGLCCLSAPIASPLTAHAEIPYAEENTEENTKESRFTIQLKNAYINATQLSTYGFEATGEEGAADNIPIVNQNYSATKEFEDLPFLSVNADGVYTFTEGSVFKTLRTKNITDMLPVPQNRGYDFLGWSTSVVSPGDYNEEETNATVRQYFNTIYKTGMENPESMADISFADTLTFYPIFDEAKIEIRYHLQTIDGDFKDGFYADSFYKFGNPKSLHVPLAGELPVGYAFAGWYKDSGFTSAVTDSSVFAAENVKTVDVTNPYPSYYIDVYGKILPQSGIVTYNAKGGTVAVKEMVYTYLSHQMPVPVKKGCLFGGWYEDRAYKVAATDYTFTKGGDITLYAKWDKISLKKPSLKLKNSKTSKLTVSIKKNRKIDGMEVQLTQNKNFSKYSKIQKKEFKGNITKATINKAKKGNTYFVRVRTYKKDSIGGKVYSKWSKTSKIIIKK